MSATRAATDSHASLARSGSCDDVEQRAVPVRGEEQQDRVAEGGHDGEERDLPVVGQDGVDAERRRGTGEPGRQRELQTEHRQRQEAQRHRQVDRGSRGPA